MAVAIKRGRALDALSLTPLIDVVFLLLIFFLVASRLSQEDMELDIPLPSAANAMPMTEEPQEMIVNIDENGEDPCQCKTNGTRRVQELARARGCE